MKPFKVSLIVPVYNVEQYLPQCLESLVSQTLDRVEIVAVNDGSTDGSLSVLEQFKARYPEKLFIYTTENRGVSHARNLGFSKARGEYVWFVDSDDYVERDACERLYRKAVSDGNDLVVFKYTNVDLVTCTQKSTPDSHYNQNFRLSEKPYELARMALYPWNKMIKYELFQGLSFPEGIRFEDVPVAFELFAKAESIGIINQGFYNYVRNIGFSDTFSLATLDICKAYRLVTASMKKMGFYEKCRKEIDYVTVRHFLYRLKKLLTNYEKGKKELKIQFINELYNYLEEEIPDWRDNHYVRYTLSAPVASMFYLYGSREEMLRFVEACDGMDENAQKAWLKAYKCAREPGKSYGPADMQEREREAFQAYRAAVKNGKPDQKQIFLESRSGLCLDTGIRALLLYLTREHTDYHIILSLDKEAVPAVKGLEAVSEVTLAEPGTKEYGKALALSGYVVSDGPLPYYTEKIPGQFLLLLCGSSLYPLTEVNCGFSKADTGLWQHSMFLADCLYFTSEVSRQNYMKSCMTEGICPTPYVIGQPPELILQGRIREKTDINRELGLPEQCEKILLCPQLLGKTAPETIQVYRSFVSALYQLDAELDEDQAAYVFFSGKNDVDFREFSHVYPMPSQYELYDFAAVCDVFISDFHPGLVHFAGQGKKVIRFVCDGMQYLDDSSLQGRLMEQGVLVSSNVPELVGFIRRTGAQEEPPLTSQGYTMKPLLEGILEKKEISAGSIPECSARPRVLYYSGRKLSNKLIEEVNDLVSSHPEKDFWFAFNHFRNPDSEKYTSRLASGCFYLPLKPDMEKGRPWKAASALISRIGLSAFYPVERIRSLGKKECGKYLGKAVFDEAVITSTDNMRTIAILMAAAPQATCTLDTFSPEKYGKSRPYRHQIRFLRRLLDR